MRRKWQSEPDADIDHVRALQPDNALLAYAVKDITNDQALVAYADIDERLAASPSI